MHEDPSVEPSGSGRKLTTTRWPGIYKRSERYVVRVRDHRGRQIQRAAKTIAEARHLRAELLADVVRGEYRAETKLTLSQYASTWVASYKGRTGRGIRPHTLAEYERDLDLHVLPRLGKLRLSEVTAQDVKALVAYLERKPNTRDATRTLSAGTIRNALAPLRALLATAVEEGLIRGNPMAGMRLAGRRTEPGRRPVLTDVELAGLLEGAKPGAPRLLLRLLAETGLRIGEAVALRWEHIDFDAGRVLVRQRRYRDSLDSPKSAYGRRDVPIGRVLTRELREHKLASLFSQDADQVFATRTGTAWRPENARRRVLLPACRAPRSIRSASMFFGTRR